MKRNHLIGAITKVWTALLVSMCGCGKNLGEEARRTGSPAKGEEEEASSAVVSEIRHLTSLMAQAPFIVEDPTKNAGAYLDDVCSRIEKMTNKADRVNGYMTLMRSACAVRLEEIGSGIGNGREEGREKSILLSNAYVVLTRMAEDVWTRMYLEGGVTGPELFDPWFELVAKLKKESARLGAADASLYVDRVDHLERLFNLFYLEDDRRIPGKDEVESVRRRFQKLVGRPMRNKEQYMSGGGRAVPYAKPHTLPTASGEAGENNSAKGKAEANASWDMRYLLQ